MNVQKLPNFVWSLFQFIYKLGDTEIQMKCTLNFTVHSMVLREMSYIYLSKRGKYSLSNIDKLKTLFTEFPRQFSKYICKAYFKRSTMLHDT